MHWRTGMCWQRATPGNQPNWIASCMWHLEKQSTHGVQETTPRAFKLSTPSEWSWVTPRHNSIFHLGVFLETRPHSGYPGKTGGRWQQAPIVRVSWHFPFQDLSSSVALPVTDLTVQNNSFPWWRSTPSLFDSTSFSKTWVGCFEEQGKLWMAFGFLCLEVLQKRTTLQQENCFCCPCENMPGIWQVTKLNVLYHCLDMLYKRSKNLIYPESIHGNRHLLLLVTRSAQWPRQTVSFTLCNVYLFLVFYKKLVKTNPVTVGNATLNQAFHWTKKVPITLIKIQAFTTFKLHNYPC